MRRILLASLLGLAGLTSCGSPDAEISFAEPLPVAGRELAGFRPRHQGLYVAVADAQDFLLLTPSAVLRQHPDTALRVEAATFADSALVLAGPASADAKPHVPAEAASLGSAASGWVTFGADTVFHLRTGTRLRRHAPAYYLSEPDLSANSWQVRRVRIEGQRLWLEGVQQDTTRLRALLPADALEVVREERRIWPLFLLRPSVRNQRQLVLRNAALWQGREYVRVRDGY